MPHVVYLHSALTRAGSRRDDAEEKRSCCASSASTWAWRWGSPASINMTMLVVAAELFHGVGDGDSIEGAHAGIER